MINNFTNLFYFENGTLMVSTRAKFKFFYFRTSPRGNSKFGVMDVPWQRLRMQQQGTDEEIQFDRIWLVKSHSGYAHIETVETRLKNIYEDYCLANKNQRAGHTEWFSDLDIDAFEENFRTLAGDYNLEVKRVILDNPYTATKRSQCPFNFPKSYHFDFYDKIWEKNCQ